MEVPTGVGYRQPTRGISVSHHSQNPNRFSWMESCPVPVLHRQEAIQVLLIMNHFLHPSTEAKRRRVCRSRLAGSAHSSACDQKIIPVPPLVRTFEEHCTTSKTILNINQTRFINSDYYTSYLFQGISIVLYNTIF